LEWQLKLLLEKQRVRVLFSFHHHLSFVAAIFVGKTIGVFHPSDR